MLFNIFQYLIYWSSRLSKIFATVGVTEIVLLFIESIGSFFYKLELDMVLKTYGKTLFEIICYLQTVNVFQETFTTSE